MRFAVLSFPVAAVTFGQSFYGTLRGRVVDARGSATGAVVITLTDEARGGTRRTITNDQGEYSFASLTPARYSLTVEAPSFRRCEKRGIDVATQAALTLEVTLELGEVSAQINVTEEAPAPETGSASTGQVLDRQKITDLPILGRNSFFTTKLTQTVVFVANPKMGRMQDQNENSQVSIPGGPVRTNNFLVDGHSDGARPGLLTLRANEDGTVAVELNAAPRTAKLVAYRPEVARAKGFPEPANYQTHTTVRDPNEVFTYSFPDTNGKIVSNEDPRFKRKVALAIVTGTWCPNCHDEAQYLVELYEKYHALGLEIVALDFEEPDQQSSLKRVNAFISKYKIPYTYLIAGEPNEMWDKLPQAVNLNTWPATLFIGKDGKVRATHAGYAGPASGEYHKQLREEFTSNIERLLKEAAPAEASAVAAAR